MSRKDDIAKDKLFRAWIQKQRCAICQKFAEWINGDGRCHAAHYNTAANAGKGTKALFSCVPLCAECHFRQHQKGILALKPKEWWALTAQQYLNQWVRGQ